MVSWMETSFVKGGKIQGIDPLDGAFKFRVWCGCEPSYIQDDDRAVQPDAFGMDRCIQEIESGKYHAIVVMDYSNNEMFEEFERDLGNHLVGFVREGGVVAFPSSESMLVGTLQRLFDVEWRRSDYYRTTWDLCTENQTNVHYSFGNGSFARRILGPYSAKGNTLRGVPPHERCFGVTKDSKTQSLVPLMTGRDVSKYDNDEDYDIIVAMHNFGKGAIAYFGDVNAEDATIRLVYAFIESRAPKLPIDCFSHLEEAAFAQVMELKQQGTIAFGEARLDDAERLYMSALELYGSKSGSRGPQKDEHVKLLSNVSLIHLKQKRWVQAESFASQALVIDEDHQKSLYRRAKACYQISQNTRGGDRAMLQRAKTDLMDCLLEDPISNHEARSLCEKVNKERSRLDAKRNQDFRTGFATAL